ncbi:MAG: helix-turn-helix transcriptional regulator [Rickettsiaceae bacterium]|jgi:transcriptional regulator with XRE-family HTH domain|nr:helix-turn-helix transcriptional regulator [Rickettsiaceae bacterium]
MANIQLKLSELMTQQNVTTSDIEKTTGLNKNTINSILTGASKNPSANTLRSIAKALDVSLEFILSGEEMDIDALNKDQMEIFSDVTNATINIIINKDLSFTIDKLNALIKEIYQYSIKINPPCIDERFIHWIIDKHKS